MTRGHAPSTRGDAVCNTVNIQNPDSSTVRGQVYHGQTTKTVQVSVLALEAQASSITVTIMPRSISYFTTSPHEENGSDGFDPTALGPRTAPPSPSAYRRHYGQLLLPDAEVDETTSLLERDGAGRRTVPRRSYTSVSATSPAPPQFRHTLSSGSLRRPRHHSRANSHGMRYSRRGSLSADQAPASTKDGMTASFTDDRTWYDQFTSTDWVHDSIADGARLRKLRSRKDIRGRLLAWFDGAQGWILVAVIGCITAALAYFVDVTEMSLFSIKEGFCSTQWFQNQRRCCGYSEECVAWKSWSQILRPSSSSAAASGDQWLDFAAFIFWVVLLSMVSCSLTLLTKTVVSSSASLSTLDENLGAEARDAKSADVGSPTSDAATNRYQTLLPSRPAMRYYSAAGSGVAEVKVINSGFVLHGYLGMKTLVCKTLALIFSVSSGLSIGKEGPYVHIGACVGNVCCRLFSKYHHNDGKRREVLSASAASGLSVAFGAPIGGVLFSLEEVSYYFPPKTLFRTFFCCIAAALSLKFLNPYGTGKIVLFEVRYLSDWEIFEIGLFILLGVLGGAAGALFIKASSLWARSFRRIPAIKRGPMLEVVLVAVVTGLISFWNRYTKLAVSELMFELASPCDQAGVATGLCPDADGVLEVIGYLAVAFVIKSFLTVVTFGVKVPAGIYVPSMVVGGLMGRIVGHVAQYFTVTYPDFFLFASCSAKDGMESCVTPGIYAMIAAGATMCGVTRLSVTLAVILFELTGSLDHVLPFCLAVLCAKWTADAIEPRSIYVSYREPDCGRRTGNAD